MPRKPRAAPARRLTLDLGAAVFEQIDAVRAALKTESITEAVRRSVAVHAFLLAATADGSKVIVRGEGGEREIVLM